MQPNLLSGNTEQFVREMATIFTRLSTELGIAQSTEPMRLFEAGEYRAAVIAAMTLLESTLRQKFHDEDAGRIFPLLSLGQLLEHALKQKLLLNFQSELRVWIRLRNEAVHTGKHVANNEARNVVDGVQRAIAQLQLQ
jgi:hypothetical protein